MKKLHAFTMEHLRSIVKIKWQDKVTNIQFHKRTGLPSMEDLLIRKNLRWTGHIWMTVFRGRFSSRSYQKDNHVSGHDQEKSKEKSIDTNSWKSLALQRDVWRDTEK